MAIVPLLAPIDFPRLPTQVSTTPGFTTTTIQIGASTHQIDFLIQAPKTGTITDIMFRTANTVTTGCTLDVRIEQVSATTGLPNGTLWGTNTNKTQVVADTDDATNFVVTLTSGASVTKGDLFAVVLDVSSGTPSSLNIAGFIDGGAEYLPSIIEDDGTPLRVSASPVLAIGYSGNDYVSIPHIYPLKDLITDTFSSSSTPDEIGMRFQIPFKASVSGCWAWVDLDGDCKFKLLDSDGVTVLASKTIDSEIPNALATAGSMWIEFDASATIEANTNYYLIAEPTTTTSMSLYSMETVDANTAKAFPAGADFQYCTAKNPTGTGSWTVTATKQPFMGIVIDGIDYTTGGGGATSYGYVS